MGLETEVESLDTIPEQLRDEYVETEDGTYRLKILENYVPADKVEDVSGLKSALQKERESARKANKTLAQLKEQYGEIDPEEYAALKEAQQQAEEDKAKKAGEWDKLKSQMVEKHNQALQAKDKEIQGVLGVLERKLVDAEAVSALNELEGNATLLLPHVKNHVRMIKDDDTGEYVARVVDDAGNPRVNGEGKYLTVRELVSEMRDQDAFAAAFKSTMRSGGGTPPGGGEGESSGGKGGTPSKDLKRSKMSRKDKVAYIKEHGEDAYFSLPA